MKPLIPVGTAKIVAEGSYGPTTWANVFYVTIDAGTHTPGDVIANCVTFIHGFYATAFSAASFPSGWALSTIVVTYRDAEDSIVRVRVADAIAGSAGAGGQDAQVAYLVNWSTGDIRRGGKPRQYVTGVPDGVVADSARLNAGTVTAVTGRLITFLTSGLTLSTPMQLVEMSFRNGNADRVAAVTFPIIGASLNPVVATQRRRVGRLRAS